MVSYQVIVFVAYLGVLQCDLYQTACIKKQPPTNFQLRLPYGYLGGYTWPCFGHKKTCKLPNAVIISVPTATPSGKTNIRIDTRKRPIGGGDDFNGPNVNGKTNVTVIVKVEGNKKNNGTNANSNYAAALAKSDENGDHLNSLSKSNTTMYDDDKTVEVEVDVENQEDSSNVNPNAGSETGDDGLIAGPDTGNDDPAAEPAAGPAKGDNGVAAASSAASATGDKAAAGSSAASAAGDKAATAGAGAGAS